jgi:hypothetical protein
LTPGVLIAVERFAMRTALAFRKLLDVDGELFWGDDRLEEVAAALR